MRATQTVHIPKALIERIKEVIPSLGYQSVAEYCRTAIRNRLTIDEATEEQRLDKKVEERMSKTCIT